MTDTTADGESLIPKITRDNEAAGSGDLVRENVNLLKALFPQIVTDGKVDFEVLRQLLGDEVEEGEERYGLNWKGKRRARAFAMTPSLGTLRPAPEDSVDWDMTQNLMIEGDNLEVLKLLRRSYAGKVKLIYIDPPYNTGNDFVYADDYKDPIGAYLRQTGEVRDDGANLTSQRSDGGRFHSNWLSMMYPRLLLAKELLGSEGLLLISIGEEEVARLCEICEEIFGNENYLAAIVWQKKYAISADSKGVPPMHDTIVAVQGSPDFMPGLLPRTGKQDSLYLNKDNDTRGPWASDNLLRNEFRPRDQFEIVAPNGKRHVPPSGTSWRHPQSKIEEMIKDNRVWFGSDGNGVPRAKRFLSEVKQGTVVSAWWPHTEVGHTDEARKEVKALIPEDVFTTPKPTRLIKRMLLLADVKDDEIVMDFFAGSGSTGAAVMAANAEDGGARRFVLVQLPETLTADDKQERAGAELLTKLQKPLNIAELTKERLRRAGQKIRAEHPASKIDTGFRVYKLATSNLKPWQPDPDNLEASVLDAVDNVLPDRTEHDLLVELLLKTGIDLTMPEERRTIAGQTVHALGGGALTVCLGNVGPDDAETLGQGMADWLDELDPTQTTIYFKDVGLGTDNNRSATKANLAAILRQRHGDRIAKIASI